MASGLESSFKEVENPLCWNDKINQWIKDGVDLVSLIDQGHIKDVENVKQYLECSGGSADIDKTNNEGQTPLMIACRNGQTAIINFLLEAGANPNLTCTKLGNSALHYACQGTGDVVSMCREEPNYPKEKLQEIIKIIQILANHGAVPGLNADGLSPVCVAALNSFRDVVEFFACSNDMTMRIIDKVKAYELLGVSQAVFDDSHLMDACESFHQASMYKDIEDTCTPHHVKSDLGAWFHDMMNKKNLSEREELQVKAKALLIGLQCLPDKIKDEHEFTDLFNQCAGDAISNVRTIEEGYSLLASLAKMDNLDEDLVICILEMLKCSTGQTGVSPEKLQLIPKLLDVYAEAFRKGNCLCSGTACEMMLDLLGGLLFNLAYYPSKSQYLEQSLPFVGTIVNSIKKMFFGESGQDAEQEQLSYMSIHLSFFESMAESMWEDVYSGQSKQTRNRVAFAIRGMLYYSGFDPDSDKSVLQNLLTVIPVARDMEFILSVCRILIRFGCPTNDAYLEDVDEDDEGVAELQELLTPPTTPIALEELASRSILCNVIPYKDRLPMVLCKKIKGDLLKYDPSELDSSPDSDSD